MANPEHGMAEELPLTSMPRMGRRNAIAYPSRILTDDDGAFSPMNLLHAASISDIDPDGAIAQELRHERRSQALYEQKLRGNVPAAPVPSVLDGWKRLHDAKNHAFNGIERLFEQTGPLAPSLSVMEAKPIKSHTGHFEEKDKVVPDNDNHRGNTVIPWRKQDVKQTTMAEERRKLFESFDMTSIEPPETPPVSELTLRKIAKKNKRKRKETGKNSEESLRLSLLNKAKETKAPYSDIQPKVITRWDKGKPTVESNPEQQGSKQPKQKVGNTGPDKVDKGAKSKKVDDKPTTSVKAKNEVSKPFSFPVKRQASNLENTTKLVTNYPASERVKYTIDKLPLTLPPRYNHKKALGMTGNAKATVKTEEPNDDSSPRLFGTIPRMKHETPKGPAGTSLQSTFLNLQRINNVGNKGNAAGGTVNKKTSSTSQLVVSRYSANILGTSTIGASPPLPARKPTPLVTMIQPPPSPFLTSKISIQSQMIDIPINGEKFVSGLSKGNKRDNKKPTRSGNLQPLKPNAIVKPNNAPTIKPQPQKANQPPAKVVPMIGSVPNKYNNIYIGPYSGSESEGDLQNTKKKR